MPDHCPTCDGWGVVAPYDPGDAPSTWADFLEDAVEAWEAGGYPAIASATLSGRIKPVPCPACGGVKTRPWHQGRPFVQFGDIDGHACDIDRARIVRVCRPAAADESAVESLVAAGLVTPPGGIS